MIEEFEDLTIEEASIQFIENGVIQPSQPFGCVGTLTIDPETEQIIKKCGLHELKNITKISKLTVNIGAHVKVQVLRELFGLTDEDLKTGVKALNKNFKTNPFIFTAAVYDMERNKKLIALPNVNIVGGLKLDIDNSRTEVAYIELEFSALYDSYGNIYYEAFESEIADSNVKTKWLTEFSPDLVRDGLSV